jgi:hypothetical protein
MFDPVSELPRTHQISEAVILSKAKHLATGAQESDGKNQRFFASLRMTTIE